MNSMYETTWHIINMIIEKFLDEHMITESEAQHIKKRIDAELMDTVNCKKIDLEACSWL